MSSCVPSSRAAGDRPDVSIIMPVYNKLQLTEPCVDSIHREGADCTFEIVVVDNGSTDGTAEVVDSFRDRLPLTSRFLAQAGIPAARNMVLENARHEVIAFTDDDCVLEPGWLQAVERGFLRADNVGMVGGWVCHEHARERSAIDTYYATFHHNTT